MNVKPYSYRLVLKFLPFYAISLLPFRVIYILSDILSFLLYHIIQYRRKVVRNNLLLAFPEKPLTEIKQIEKDFYRYLTDVFLEAIKILTLSQEKIKKRFFIENVELVDEVIATRSNFILLCSHHGNWEWMASLSWQSPYPVTTFYKVIENRYFNDLMLHIRTRYGFRCIDSDSGFKWIINQIKQKSLIWLCMIADQTPHGQSSYQWLSFFNRPTAFYTGIERIHKLTQAYVFYPQFIRHRRGYYTLSIHKLSPTEDILQQYARHLEESIRQLPSAWLWSHRRWKMTSPA